jgi:hypothetical protein
MKSLFKESKESTLGFLLKALDKDKSNFFLAGLLNIESGDISVRTRRYNEKTDSDDEFRECPDCSSVEENRVFFVDCKSCGKAKENYFWLKSGDGDGVYVAFQIFRLDESTGESVAVGLAAVFMPTDVFAQPLVEGALKNALDLSEPIEAFAFLTELLEDFGDLAAFEVTSFNVENGEGVFLADKNALVDTFDAIIGLAFDDHPDDAIQLSFLAFSEAIGSQSMGPYPNEVSPRPRVLIGLDSSWLATQGFQATMKRPDSPDIFQDWIMTGIESSHIEPMADVCAWFNFKINKAMEKHNYAASWLLQGAIHGDEDCINEISCYEEYFSDSEWIKTWLEQRHQYSAVLDFEISNKLPFSFAAKKSLTGLIYAGSFAVDSGQAMVGDPCYLDEWDTNKNEEWNIEGNKGKYSYQGATATTVEDSYGELGICTAVVFSCRDGQDGVYPVYVQLNGDDKISMVVIDFEGTFNDSIRAAKKNSVPVWRRT